MKTLGYGLLVGLLRLLALLPYPLVAALGASSFWPPEYLARRPSLWSGCCPGSTYFVKILTAVLKRLWGKHTTPILLRLLPKRLLILSAPLSPRRNVCGRNGLNISSESTGTLR